MKANRKPAKAPPPDHSAPEASPVSASAPPQEPVSASHLRRWTFRVAAVILAFVVVAGGMEGVLRWVGAGYPSNFFLKTTVRGQAALVENPRFAWRFMPPALARVPPQMVVPARKAPNTCRIFVLGESAAMGDPEPAHGLPRVLKVLLEGRFPDRKFEVVNVAMTAINSHAILSLARECARLEGDFWVVYMGNNEVMGPFGASTVFGRPTPNLTLLRAGLALKTTKTGQVLEAGLQRLRERGQERPAWGGLEMFLNQQIPPDDPRLETVHRHFASNLRKILEAGSRSGAKVVVSTLVSNLKDCAPFGSLHAPGLSEAQRAEWDRLYLAAARAEAGGQFAEALTKLEQAERIDGRYAELQYRLGRAHWLNGHHGDACRHFELARDLDTLRFRADARLNALIAQTAAGREQEGIYFVDAAEAFARESPHGVVGDELLYEHVHFRIEGNYLLAKLLAEPIARSLSAGQPAASPVPWPAQAEVAQRLAVTDWSRFRVIDTLRRRLARPPFVAQLNFRERDQRLQKQLAELQPGVQRAAFEAQAQIYRQAVERTPDDWLLHDQFAKFREAFGDMPGAVAEWRKVIELVPHHLLARYQLGVALNGGETVGEAEAYLREAVQLRPDFPEAINELGLALARQRKFTAAYEQFARAVVLRPDFAGALANWGLALTEEGKLAEARARFEAALALSTNSLSAHLNLAKLLVQQGQAQQAAPHFREVLRLDPRNRTALKFFEETPGKGK